MALFDAPPHRVSLLRPQVSRDSGGGVDFTYQTIATSLPCAINTASASEVARFAAAQIRVTHSIAFLVQDLPTMQPGDVLHAEDTNRQYRIQGLRTGREYGQIPAFLYAECEEIL